MIWEMLGNIAITCFNIWKPTLQTISSIWKFFIVIGSKIPNKNQNSSNNLSYPKNNLKYLKNTFNNMIKVKQVKHFVLIIVIFSIWKYLNITPDNEQSTSTNVTKHFPSKIKTVNRAERWSWNKMCRISSVL